MSEAPSCWLLLAVGCWLIFFNQALLSTSSGEGDKM